MQLFDGNIFNWDVDTFSYNPGLKVRYEYKMGSTTLIPSVAYTELFVDSVSTSSDIIDVNSSSGVMNAKLRIEIEDVFCINEIPFRLVPQVGRTDIYADARSGIGVGHFYDFSLAVLAKGQHYLPFFKDIGISTGFTLGEDVKGWRLGLEGAL